MRYGPLSFAVKGTRILPFPAFVLGCCCGGDCRFLFRPVICWLPGWDFFFFRLHCKDGCVRSSDLRCLGHSEVLAFAAVAKRLVSFSAAGGETFLATGFLAGGGGWCCPCFSLSMEWSMFFQWLRFVVDLLQRRLLRHIQGFGVPWRGGRWTWMDSGGLESLAFEKTVEAPGCVFNYLVHQGVFCKYAGLYCMSA